MKSKCPVFVSCLVMACVTSCSTGAKRELAQAGGGLATVSAMVVALPLIPVAGVHQLVSPGGPEAKRERAAERELKALLDPIYQERTKMIEQRVPILDVREALAKGPTGLLPQTPNAVDFPGLPTTAYDGQPGFGRRNYEIVQNNEVTRYLEELMGLDPLHQQHRYVYYHSSQYRKFQRACNEYRMAFNREVLHRNKTVSPAPSK